MGDSDGLKPALEGGHDGGVLGEWRDTTQIPAQGGQFGSSFEFAQSAEGIIEGGEVAGRDVVLVDADVGVVYESIDGR
jgi:hypothetical protein